MLTARVGINLSAGTSLAQTGTVVLSNSNGISFGMTTLASSVIVTLSLSNTMTAAVLSLSAGTTQVTSGEVVISKSNNFSFGVNGQTITAGQVAASYWHNSLATRVYGLVGSTSAQNVELQRAAFAWPISATRADLRQENLTLAGSTAGSFTMSIGIYTISRSTAALASSASAAVTWNSGTNTAAASIYAGQSGGRWRSIGLGTWAITPGEYLIGFAGSIAGVAGSTMALSLNGSVRATYATAAGAISAYWANGVYSTGSGALPASIQLSELDQTASHAQPYLQFAGTF